MQLVSSLLNVPREISIVEVENEQKLSNGKKHLTHELVIGRSTLYRVLQCLRFGAIETPCHYICFSPCHYLFFCQKIAVYCRVLQCGAGRVWCVRTRVVRKRFSDNVVVEM